MFLITGEGDASLQRLVSLMYNIETGEPRLDWANLGNGSTGISDPRFGIPGQEFLATGLPLPMPARDSDAKLGRPVGAAPGFLTIDVDPVTAEGIPTTHCYFPTVGIIAYVPASASASEDDDWGVGARDLAARLAKGLDALGYEHLAGLRPADSVDHTVLHRDWGYSPETRTAQVSHFYESFNVLKKADVVPGLASGADARAPARIIVSATHRHPKALPKHVSHHSAFTWVIVPAGQLLCERPKLIDSPAEFNARMTGIVYDTFGLFAEPREARGVSQSVGAIRDFVDLLPPPPELERLKGEAFLRGRADRIDTVVTLVVEGDSGRLHVAGECLFDAVHAWVDLGEFEVPELAWDEVNPAGLASCGLCGAPLVGRVYAFTGGVFPPYGRRGWDYGASNAPPGEPLLGEGSLLLCRFCCGASVPSLNAIATNTGFRLRATRAPDARGNANDPATAQARALRRAGPPWDAFEGLADCVYRVGGPGTVVGTAPSGEEFCLVAQKDWMKCIANRGYMSVYIDSPELWDTKFSGLCCNNLAIIGLARAGVKPSPFIRKTVADITGPVPSVEEVIGTPPPSPKKKGRRRAKSKLD